MAKKLVCRLLASMSGLTVLILNCQALFSGMCAQHIPWRAFKALTGMCAQHIPWRAFKAFTKAQEKVRFVLEEVGQPNASTQHVATPMLLSCPP